jgi:2-succinyl-6-hydroxy-2,4-cyclohexadiene-1-carboxylate synthase
VLFSETRGAEGREPVVLLHGFTQSSRSWGRIADVLASSHRVTTIDAPGHGRSATVQANLERGADLMAETAPHPGTWIGYSMGGRFALHVALRRPQMVTRLVLVSATAGIEDDRERAQRRDSDAALADRAEREGLEPFVRWWVSQPMFATLPLDEAGIDSRLGGSAGGLASSLRLAGTGSQEPLWTQLPALAGRPTLIVAGERDAKYAAIAARMRDAIGEAAQLHVLPGAGHACHLEQPDRFLEVVTAFLGPGD